MCGLWCLRCAHLRIFLVSPYRNTTRHGIEEQQRHIRIVVIVERVCFIIIVPIVICSGRSLVHTVTILVNLKQKFDISLLKSRHILYKLAENPVYQKISLRGACLCLFCRCIRTSGLCIFLLIIMTCVYNSLKIQHNEINLIVKYCN